MDRVIPGMSTRPDFWLKLKPLPMSVMIIHIVVSLLIALGFLAAFIWAIRSNQYDDDYSPSVRMLFDEHKPEKQYPNT